MAYRLTWSPTARLDLRELTEFISEDDPFAARKFVRHLVQTIERLQFFPESGRIVPEFADPMIREVIRPPCRIVYRVNHDKSLIEIIRIWHAMRGTPDIGI
jgi:plasmid stabilization system protein ParE